MIDFKHLCIRFDKIDGFIRVYDGTRYLVLFGSKKYDLIYTRIRYLIWVKCGITYVISNGCGKIEVNSYNALEKTITFHNVILGIKSVWNKDNIVLEKCSYRLPQNTNKL